MVIGYFKEFHKPIDPAGRQLGTPLTGEEDWSSAGEQAIQATHIQNTYRREDLLFVQAR